VASASLLVADRVLREAPLESLTLATSDDRTVDPFQLAGAATVFLFTRDDCPVSNRYAPEVRRLCESFTPRNVTFWLVYPDPDARAADVRQHISQYDYPCAGLLDPRHELVKRCGAQITPEAAVFLADGSMVYRGRIDDRQVAFGVARSVPTRRDLEEVLTAVVDGQPVQPRTTKAVGCFIADLQ
jgi:peroxiredoxin